MKQEIAAGQFRDDLYYRLNVIELPLPWYHCFGSNLYDSGYQESRLAEAKSVFGRLVLPREGSQRY